MYHNLIVAIFNFRKKIKFDYNNMNNEKGKYPQGV